MKIFRVLILSLFTVTAQAQAPDFDPQTWVAPYEMPTPKGWGVERIPFPISFAPQIPYQGMEDIRFMPGWAKAKSDEYWSYVFLWYLEGNIQIDATIIAEHMKTYYTGLIASMGKDIATDKMIPVNTSFRETTKGELQAFTGTIHMLDYMQKKLMTLNCRLKLKYDPSMNKTFLFFELSPQPFSHSVWASLEQLWVDMKFKKE